MAHGAWRRVQSAERMAHGAECMALSVECLGFMLSTPTPSFAELRGAGFLKSSRES